jgi:IS30 family transposase
VIAARLSRSASTVSRELMRDADRAVRYRATTAHALTYERAARPKPAKLATNLVLRAKVAQDPARRYSPSRAPAGCAASSFDTRCVSRT